MWERQHCSSVFPQVRLFISLLVPQISSEFYRAQVTYLDGNALFVAGLISVGAWKPGLHVKVSRSPLHLLPGRLPGLREG